MRCRPFFWALGLLLAGLPVRAAAAPTFAGDPPEALEAPDAKRLFRERKYLEAARAFEQLWTASHEPPSLFNAAQAREMTGHELRACLHLLMYLDAPGLTEAEHGKARDRLAGLRGRTPQVRLLVVPADVAPAKLRLEVRRQDDPGTDSESVVVLDGRAMEAVAVPGYPGAYDLPIEAGAWDLTLTMPGDTRVGSAAEAVPSKRGRLHQVVLRLAVPKISAGMVPVKPVPSADDGEQPRHKLAVSMLAAGSVSAVAGVAVLVVGATVDQPSRDEFLKIKDVMQGDCKAVGNCSFDPGAPLMQARALRLYAVGGALVGVGAGLLTHGLSLRHDQTRRSMHVRMGVGGGLLVVGLAAGIGAYVGEAGLTHFTTAQRFAEVGGNKLNDRAALEGRIAASTLGWGLAGAGASLLITSLVDRASAGRRRAVTVSPHASARHVGATLSLSF